MDYFEADEAAVEVVEENHTLYFVWILTGLSLAPPEGSYLGSQDMCPLSVLGPSLMSHVTYTLTGSHVCFRDKNKASLSHL